MEKADTSKKTLTRKCGDCDVNYTTKRDFVLHLLGKRHQKKIKQRDKSHLINVRERTVCVSGKMK